MITINGNSNSKVTTTGTATLNGAFLTSTENPIQSLAMDQACTILTAATVSGTFTPTRTLFACPTGPLQPDCRLSCSTTMP